MTKRYVIEISEFTQHADCQIAIRFQTKSYFAIGLWIKFYQVVFSSLPTLTQAFSRDGVENLIHNLIANRTLRVFTDFTHTQQWNQIEIMFFTQGDYKSNKRLYLITSYHYTTSDMFQIFIAEHCTVNTAFLPLCSNVKWILPHIKYIIAKKSTKMVCNSLYLFKNDFFWCALKDFNLGCYIYTRWFGILC